MLKDSLTFTHHLEFATLRCVEESFKTALFKWLVSFVVMNPLVQSVKKHKKKQTNACLWQSISTSCQTKGDRFLRMENRNKLDGNLKKNMFKFKIKIYQNWFFYGCEKHHVMITRYPLRTSISLRKETHESWEFPLPWESKVPPPMPPQETIATASH